MLWYAMCLSDLYPDWKIPQAKINTPNFEVKHLFKYIYFTPSSFLQHLEYTIIENMKLAGNHINMGHVQVQVSSSAHTN